MIRKLKTIAFVLVIPIGIFLIVFGGYDDSPGGQMLGLLAVVAGIAGLVWVRKKSPRRS